ncbi:MAG: lipoyl(octanoyl) transferase LipB [Thermodesulfobacteriota bacterium]
MRKYIWGVRPILSANNKRGCQVRRLGLVAYDRALSLQRDLTGQRSRAEIPDTLLLLEHPPTYTLGPKSEDSHFMVSKEWLTRHGVAVRRVDRGGAITFHGPGQLVGYPILQLKERREIVPYLRNLEAMVIQTLGSFGLEGDREQAPSGQRPATGVWVNNEKIAAIGVRLDGNNVTSHGFAINVDTDLHYFDKIVSCGLSNRTATSLNVCLDRPVGMQQVQSKVVQAFAEVFNYELNDGDQT